MTLNIAASMHTRIRSAVFERTVLVAIMGDPWRDESAERDEWCGVLQRPQEFDKRFLIGLA